MNFAFWNFASQYFIHNSVEQKRCHIENEGGLFFSQFAINISQTSCWTHLLVEVVLQYTYLVVLSVEIFSYLSSSALAMELLILKAFMHVRNTFNNLTILYLDWTIWVENHPFPKSFRTHPHNIFTNICSKAIIYSSCFFFFFKVRH